MFTLLKRNTDMELRKLVDDAATLCSYAFIYLTRIPGSMLTEILRQLTPLSLGGRQVAGADIELNGRQDEHGDPQRRAFGGADGNEGFFWFRHHAHECCPSAAHPRGSATAACGRIIVADKYLGFLS